MSPSSPAGSSSSSLPDSSALLALPDGPISANHADRTSYAISLIGGYPTFPLSTPPLSSDLVCASCSAPIPLLAQVYCPPEGGENDRTLYVFACPNGGCQRKEGSVRAWRASRRNDEYVADVEKMRAEKEAEEKRLADERRKNPFTMGAAQPAGSALFGGGGGGLFGANLFAAPASAPAQAQPVPELSNLSISSASTSTLSPPHPAYQPPQYLSTTDEYLPPPEEVDLDSDDDEQSPEEKAEWRDERFEQLFPSGVDPLFERFVKRISEADGAGGQVLRYDLGGVPLPYSTTSSLTQSLFPGLPAACRAQKAEDDDPSPSTFFKPSSSLVPPCPRCAAPRVFELQLVPSLINHLSPETLSTTGEKAPKKGKSAQSEEERKKELARLAGEEAGGEGMEWGSIVVFGCKGDCEGFEEEWVGVEWETTLA